MIVSYILIFFISLYTSDNYDNPGYYNLPNIYYFSPFVPYYNNPDDEKYYEEMTHRHDLYGYYSSAGIPSDVLTSPYFDWSHGHAPIGVSPYLQPKIYIIPTNYCWYWGC